MFFLRQQFTFCQLFCLYGLVVRAAKDSTSFDTPSEPWWGSRPQPYFGNIPTNITLISGQTAYLPCRVHMLGNRSVTWMRGRDLHILTVGLVTYSADDRFQILHSENTDDWTLQIQYSQPRDSGVYKCQVNSDPKIVRNVFLTVTDKRFLDGNLYKLPSNSEGEFSTSIPGPPERYLQAGSSLVLDCIVRHTRAAPTAVLWYHNNKVLDYDSPRGGISLQLEKSEDQTTSRLHLSSVREVDSGSYSCVPVNAPKATVSVHINNDELRAAVQQGGIGSSGGSSRQSRVFWSEIGNANRDALWMFNANWWLEVLQSSFMVILLTIYSSNITVVTDVSLL